mmetsp:Transcript_34593/g.44413  ORF Transcript_34593/g.44413 Transcript_34593/m.44413 type:complete len:192 (+) Transcript_34593:51-626(+)
MTSTIKFKFKSAKDFDAVSFSGMGVRLFDLKRLIVEKRQMKKGLDFDLQLTNSTNGEVYRDEDQLISKNTSVVVKRVPASKNGLLKRIKDFDDRIQAGGSQKLYSSFFVSLLCYACLSCCNLFGLSCKENIILVFLTLGQARQNLAAIVVLFSMYGSLTCCTPCQAFKVSPRKGRQKNSRSNSNYDFHLIQ